MLKKFWLFIVLILFGVFTNQSAQKPPHSTAKKEASLSPAFSQQKISNSIFIPYWALDDQNLNVDNYERVIYFGVKGSISGINKQDQGYRQLSAFVKASADKQKYLTLTMTNSDINFAVLEDKSAQQKIINETIETMRQYNFSGLVLDLELFSLFNDKIPDQINQFAQSFYQQVKQSGFKFAITLYADTFYRKRPYDVSTLAKNADEIMIMAYDFSKSRGEPGPNFPFEGHEKFGYDFKTMIADFTAVVPVEKLSVIFGMYGYDWVVDEKKRPIRPAQSLSDNQIKEKYLSKCSSKNCVVLHDNLSKETEIDFVEFLGLDANDFAQEQTHIIWFEDQKSAQTKQEYLKQQGVTKFSYWSYGYF